jgi:NDP-sugar pyrophosphorylase family protein
MRIIIPMSGIGKRFLDAGYSVPKPLIEVEGQPIINHIVDLFPNETQFHFICNSLHLETTNMRSILLQKVPTAVIHTVSVEARKGPVDAVLQIQESIPDDEEVIVSYCDYGTQWEYQAFLNDMRSTGADGGIAAYIGFHPHMCHGDNYAFLQHQKKWVTDIQEKKSFTEDKMNEYASNGTYYFRSGALLKRFFQELVEKDMTVNGEYYVSLVYKLMIQAGLRVRVFEIQKMLQWGTPRDLEEYSHWSTYFLQRKTKPLEFRGLENYTLLLPMAGSGNRFRIVGYDTPKPLLPVNGTEMVVSAVNCLPPAKRNVFVCLEDHLKTYPIQSTLQSSLSTVTVVSIPTVTEGQACTCEMGIEKATIDKDESLLISACDNGAYYNLNDFYKMVDDPTIDVIVWSFTNNPTSKLYPHWYAWLDVDEDKNIRDISIKKQFQTKPSNHCIIGTMYFRKTSLFLEGLQDIYRENFRTNGEFYVDNLLLPLIRKGYTVKAFEVDNYLCWGTPNDYKTYLYWDEYFSSKKANLHSL